MSEIELTFDMNALNPDKLHEELMAAAGDRGFFGISTAPPKTVRAHFMTDANADDLRALVEPVIRTHDPKQKTAAQARADANAALLAALRKPWAEWTEADKDAVLRVLAQNLIDLPEV